ncbi:MAG TPA: hypothetical protein VLQ65_16285 [Saliniramus sp.]|nr:hypothetical protein [Saliniramus sp.]
MTERLDAPAPTGETERAAGYTPLPLSARGFSAIMHREAALRTPVRPPRQSAAFDGSDQPFATLDLPPPLRRAVAALLRGDYVSPDERLALGRAVSLLSQEERAPSASLWESFASPANSNCAETGQPVKAIVPPSPTPLGPDTDNPILRDLLRGPGNRDDA